MQFFCIRSLVNSGIVRALGLGNARALLVEVSLNALAPSEGRLWQWQLGMAFLEHLTRPEVA